MNYKIEDCPKDISGIYKINFPNGKSYIGLSSNILRRIKEHNNDKKQPVLYSAIQKYFNGKIPEIEILEQLPNDRKLLLEREKYYISIYNTNDKDKGYNLNEGGNLYGTANVSAIFNSNQIEDIYNLLEYSDLPMYKIALLYGCERNTIEKINSGKTYYSSNNNYPIRKNKYKTASGSKNPNASINNDQLQLIINDLLNYDLLFEDITKKYNISMCTLSNINRGIHYKKENIEYPIRRKNAIVSRKRIFTEEEMAEIKNLLENSKMTMSDISNKFHCDRKVIGNINNGTRQKQEDWNYPIRKTH